MGIPHNAGTGAGAGEPEGPPLILLGPGLRRNTGEGGLGQIRKDSRPQKLGRAQLRAQTEPAEDPPDRFASKSRP